jgi:hypothetical protein
MKAVAFFIVSLFVLTNLQSQVSTSAGQLKITIESVRCINKSWDGFVELDGHGSEIMVGFSSRIYNPANTNAARSGIGFTRVFGSNVNGQVRAGSQTANLGGINNGDVVPINQVVFNEHMDADDIVLFAPTLWEVDDFNDRTTINLFNVQLANDLNWAVQQTFPFANTVVEYGNADRQLNQRVFKIFDKYSYGQALKYHNIMKHLFIPNAQGNRPIGVRSGLFGTEMLVSYPPTLLALDTRVLNLLYLNNASSNNTGTSHAEKESYRSFIAGVNVNCIENTYNVATSNGSYSLFLRIEFVPDRASTTTSGGLSGLPTKNPGTIKKDMPARTINISNTTLAVAGRWTGNQTSDAGLYPQAITFELTANNEFVIKDGKGTVASKGTYSFSNNAISGSYKQLSSGETFSFSGIYDPNTQKITGTVGSGTSVTGQGRWVVTKN